MRKTYKNKRDFYKALAESNKSELEKTKRQLKIQEDEYQRYTKSVREESERRKAAEKSRYSAWVYCTNCGEVHSVNIPTGVTIKDGDCVNCRVRGCQLTVTNGYNLEVRQ